MRHILLVVVCLGVLLFPALGSSAVQKSNTIRDSSTGPLGIVPPQIPKSGVRPSALVSPDGPTLGDNLTYQGGPIMPTATNYAIYWAPSGYSIPSNYKSVIDGYFTNVAAATGGSSNVYAAGTQYYDSSNYIRYSSTFGGSAIDTQPFPASGCTNPSDVVGATKCLSDSQLRAEVQRFAAAQGWPHGPNVEFFVYTAPNVGSCDGDQCAYDVYCAYHSEFTSSGAEYIYANMPYSLQPFMYGGVTYSTDCAVDGQGHPNAVSSSPWSSASAADYDLNVTSHESNESITDPLGTAWWVDNGLSSFAGYEDGDLCAWNFPDGANLGGSSSDGSLYNQAINGGHYFLQGEWSNDSATGSENSGCTWSFSGAVPADSSTPSVTGTPTVGQVLTGNPGSWTGSPSRYWYTWQRCDSGGANCSAISSSVTTSTTPNYTLTNADATHTIRLMVGGANSAGAGTGVQTSATGVIAGSQPANTGVPTITGTATVGQVLTAHAGTWSNSPNSYSYQWQRCDSGGSSCVSLGSPVSTSASTVNHTLLSADGGQTLRVQVTASNGSGAGSAAISDATGVVDSGLPVYSSGVAITGTPTVGQILTGSAGNWSHSPTKYTYVWQRCDSGGASCTTIKTVSNSTATSPTYTLVAADDKHTIRLDVTAINIVGSSAAQVTGATGVVNGEPVYSSGFSLTGTATVGQKLTANAGTWSLTPTKYTYTWQRCDSGGANCATIKTLATSATSATYTLVAADDKHTIKVSVFAQNAAGTGTPQTSSATSVVNGEPVYSSGFSLTGTATVGQKLTANAGTWSLTPTKYTYTWQRCDSGGANCATIKTLATSATSATYTLVAADHGNTIRVIVTVFNAAGSGLAQMSDASAVVV